MKRLFGNFYINAFLGILILFVAFQIFSFQHGGRLENVGGNLGSMVHGANSAGDRIEKVYYPNGKLQAEISMRDGKHHGITKTYYESGKIFSEENFIDGKQEGISKSYYETGELLYEKTYKHGRLITLKEFNKQGEVTFEGGF